MQAFQDISRSLLGAGSYFFDEPDPGGHAITILQEGHEVKEIASAHSLLQTVRNILLNQKMTPECIIIHVKSSKEGALRISSDVFQELLDRVLHVNYSAVWLLLHKYDGYHRFPPPRSQDGEHPEFAKSRIETSYFGCSRYVLLWSYDYVTLATKALYISRSRRKAEPNEDTNDFWALGEYLIPHRSFMASPSFLGYVGGLAKCAGYDSQEGEKDWALIRRIEDETGYGQAGRPQHVRADRQRDNDQFQGWLQETGEVLINISAHKRTLRSILNVLDQVEQKFDWSKLDVVNQETEGDNIPGRRFEDPEARGLITEDTRELIQKCNDDLEEAVPQFRNRILTYIEYLDYMAVRTERLSTVLFALLTHKDASTGIEQAKASLVQTEASRELAEAAKKDSSAMKTIAVMTMAFLPATFFAALFAIPSLDWSSNPVIQSNHWVYWAFTLPATLVVFLIWVVLDNRQYLLTETRPGKAVLKILPRVYRTKVERDQAEAQERARRNTELEIELRRAGTMLR